MRAYCTSRIPTSTSTSTSCTVRRYAMYRILLRPLLPSPSTSLTQVLAPSNPQNVVLHRTDALIMIYDSAQPPQKFQFPRTSCTRHYCRVSTVRPPPFLDPGKFEFDLQG